MKKPTVLVTGGTGYIGSHTSVELINEGYEVVVIDNLSNSNAESLNGVEKITGVRPKFEQFDLCNKALVDNFFQKYGDVKAIIHFAASKAVGESVEKPLLYYRNNLTSLINILDAMGTYKVPNIVFSSSCTVYGQPEKLPVTENAPLQKALSPYGNTKQICEDILKDTISASPALKAISLRYFNPIGAHPTALIGELPLGVPANLVPFITQTAIGIREQLKVFGNDYDTPDGTCIRDYIHVVDLAKAHVVAIGRLLEEKNKANYEVFNIGTGNGNTVLEAINSFEKVSGVKLNYKIVDRRPGDIEKVWADTTYANQELGWKAKSTLDETMLSAWKWEKHLRNK
jgi:UDP-glucose 4-epimerase